MMQGVRDALMSMAQMVDCPCWNPMMSMQHELIEMTVDLQETYPPSADFASEERAVLEENCLSNKTPVHGARPCWPSKTRDNGSTHAPLWTRHLSNVTGGVQSITCCESCY